MSSPISHLNEVGKQFMIFISLHTHSVWETTVMHKQVSGWTVNFCPNSPESPFLEYQTRKPPPPEIQIWGDQSFLQNTPPRNSDLRWPKFTPEYPPPEIQIWGDQSFLQNTPQKFRFEVTKVYSGIPPLSLFCNALWVQLHDDIWWIALQYG